MATSRAQIFVVVPAYNEAEVITRTLEPLIETGYSVVVVDDGSTDQTSQKLAPLRVHYLRHPINLGQGAALVTGTRHALEQGAELIVHFDADGQHSAQGVLALITPLEEQKVDVTLGSRFLRRQDSDVIPPFRRWLLRVAILANWALTGVRLSDAHNGMRALTKNAAKRLHLTANRYDHATEILGEIRRLGLTYCEVPTHIIYSEYARAKGQSLWNALNIVMDSFLRKVFR